jgi:hypothetical protein
MTVMRPIEVTSRFKRFWSPASAAAQFMAQHHHAICTCAILLGSESASHFRSRAEQRKQIRRNLKALEAPGSPDSVSSRASPYC